MRWFKNKTLAALLLGTLLLIGCNWLLAVVVGNGRFIGVALGYAAVLIIAKMSNFSWADLGLSRQNVKSGLLWGLLASAGSVIVMVGAFAINPDLFRDGRYNQSAGSLLGAILFSLPFGTVLLEELIFRGVYYHFGVKLRSANFGIGLSAGLFGLWHILSARAFQSPFIYIPQLVTVTGIVVVTSLAGLFFAGLRYKSNSLLAPLLFHWVINASAMILAFMSFRV